MRRYFRHILLSLISVICTVSCIKELDDPNPVRVSDTPTVLVPRVKSFTNQYITKAGYTTDETQISSLTVLVFNNDGTLVHIQQPSNLSSIELNKSMLDAPGQDVTAATIVMIANVGLDKITDGNGNTFKKIKEDKLSLTLSGMEKCTFDFSANPVITSIPDDFDGFPMIGGVKNVNLSATKESQNAISVPLKILYAKINFSISVANGTENTGTGMQFTLNGYSVHNVAQKTGMAIPTEKGMPVLDFLGNIIDENVNAENDGATVSTYTESVTGIKTGITDVSEQPITFTFYVAENRYNHSGLSGIYPDGWLAEKPEEDVKGYNPESEEDLKKINGVKYFYDDYIQQYKPKLAGSSRNATYVLLEGLYTDYRGTVWDVDYKVYLGKDNAQNFHVDRNSEYTNSITIKGIRNNDSYIDRDDEGNITSDQRVWIDHRVNVTLDGKSPNKAADCVTITRETLIDSHIEVRPLRVKWDEGAYTFARIHLPYYTEDNGKTWVQRDETAAKKNWIGIERGNKTSSMYCKDGVSKGKRKYFTSSLISNLCTKSGDTDIETYDGVDFILLNNNDCAWIYIDEYIYNEGTTTIANEVRTAKIVVDFCTVSGDQLNIDQKEEYILYQQPLFNISGGKYYLENYEEYLHSYDSHDKYNIETSPTDYTSQGLQWGYNGLKVSKSQFVTNPNAVTGSLGSFWESITNPDNGNPYDFFHSKDSEVEEGFKVQDTEQIVVDLSNNVGFNFTFNASEQNGITISSMGEMPTSAYQYCLSKNKFTEAEEGEDHTMMVHWYVPDAYELSDIFDAENSPLSGTNYYWSSQAEYNVSSEKTYISEDVSNARAISASSEIVPLSRSEKHRIRCVYDLKGKEANMSSRTPEGIGGLIKIPMTVAGDGFFNYDPWFTNLGVIETEYSNTAYRYPMGDTYPIGDKNRDEADDYFGGSLIDGVHYYSKNPLDSLNNWGRLGTSTANYTYDAMNPNKWPGLSKLEARKLGNVIERYGFGANPVSKQDKRTYTSRSGRKIDALPSDVNNIYLDHNEETVNALSISFDKGKNSSNVPKYEYYNEDGSAAVRQTWVKYWNVPEYSSKDFPSTDKKTFSALERAVSYTDSEVKNKIDNEFNSLVGALLDDERFTYSSHTAKPITTKSIYSYASASDARNAATTYFNEAINANGEYKAISNSDISTPSQSVELCSYTYTYKKEIRYWERPWYNPIIGQWGDWEDNGTGTGSGILTKTLYTYVITYQKLDGTYYRYVAGTGGWGEEIALSEEPVSIEPEKPNADALTFYAGNTFTINSHITTDADGKQYKNYIRSVKVNYNTSTITEGDIYLRFVSGATYLPANNVEPLQMAYLDGDNGWSKWTSSTNDESVTLRLVIYDKSAGGLFNWLNPQFAHTDPTYSYGNRQYNYNLTITSLEIRLEQVPL